MRYNGNNFDWLIDWTINNLAHDTEDDDNDENQERDRDRDQDHVYDYDFNATDNQDFIGNTQLIFRSYHSNNDSRNINNINSNGGGCGGGGGGDGGNEVEGDLKFENDVEDDEWVASIV